MITFPICKELRDLDAAAYILEFLASGVMIREIAFRSDKNIELVKIRAFSKA
jgi:hypothetical protein